MFKNEIILRNGESDGYAEEYCDDCGAEAATKEFDGFDMCQDCLRSALREAEQKAEEMDVDDTEGLRKLCKRITQLEKLIKIPAL